MHHPKYLSFHSRTQLCSSAGLKVGGENFFVARNLVAGRVSNLRERPAPSGFDRIVFEPFCFETGMDWYRGAYEEFHSSFPELKSWVPITDEEDLRTCEKDGWIFQVRIDDNIAGLIAAERKSFLGEAGAYMTELLLVPLFKGQGLGAALQRKLIDILPPEITLIWGTIDARNKASMKTAIGLGRQVVRSEYFLTLENHEQPDF